MTVDGVDVIVEGRGASAILMIHGWPDTYRLWDHPVAALRERYRCVRFTLPGYDRSPGKRAYSLEEIIETIRRVVDQTCPRERVTLLLHDWGCVFGYQFAMRHAHLVERIIGVDVGDGGSRRHRAELRFKAKTMVIAYQWWLALAWRIGGGLGDRMARWLARTFRCPVDLASVHSRMGYPYALRWLGVAGGLRNAKPFDPPMPLLYIYGERKPFMFHSTAWAQRVAARAPNRIIALPTRHWVMHERPREFNQAVLGWLQETEQRA
jgi:pimeloyl-ACP methyl ester carboxylesterase